MISFNVSPHGSFYSMRIISMAIFGTLSISPTSFQKEGQENFAVIQQHFSEAVYKSKVASWLL